jgi:outer membrane protein assembly factor BamB
LLYQLPTGSYIVGSPAETDGNLVAVSGDGFLYDLTPGGGAGVTPSTAVTSPANSSTVPNPGGNLTVSGTAAAPGGLSAVEVDVQRSDGSWWDGATATWTAGPYPNAATLAHRGGTTSTWTMTFPAAASGDTYEAFAGAVSGGVADNSVGLSSPTAARSSFTVSPATTAPTLSVASMWVPPGSTVGLSGAGFVAGETVDLALGSLQLKPTTATKTGTLPTTQLRVPGSTAFGPTAVVATGASSGRSTSAALYVTNSWTQFGGSAAQQADDPFDSVFTQHLSVSSSTYLTQAWSFTTSGPVAGSVDVAEGTAYVADESGSVYAVSLASAMQLWKHTVPSAHITSTPALTSSGTVIVDTTGGKVVALSQSTGQPVWSVSLAGTPGSPTVAGSTVYIGSSTGTLTALNAQTGVTSWTATLPGVISSSPAVDTTRSLVIVSDGSGALSALNATTGSVVWTKTVAGAIVASPVVAGGAVYVGSADHSAYSFAETTGALNWSYATGGAVTVAPAFINGDMAIGSSNGTVSYLVPATGGVRFTVKEGSPVAGLAGAGNFLVATDTNGNVHGSKPGSSDPNAWLATQGTSLSAAPTVVNGEVFVPGLNSTLAVFTVPGSPVF